MDFTCCVGLTGAVDKIVLPEGMQTVIFKGCTGLTGDLTQWHLPVGMKNLNLCETKVTGDVTQLRLPDGMQSLDLSGSWAIPMKITGTCEGT